MNRTLQGSVVWLISSLFVIYGYCVNAAIAAFSDQIKTSLQISDQGLSIILCSFIVGFAFMQIPAGFLLDRFNTKILLSFAVFISALGNILITQAQSLAMFSFANFLQGVGNSFAFISVGLLISEWFSAAMFPILMGLFETFFTIIAGFMHYFFVAEFESFTWENVYRVLVYCGVIIFLLTVVFVQSPSTAKKKRSTTFWQSLKTILKNRQVMLCTIATATSFGILLSYADFWYVKIQKFYSVAHEDTALIGSLFYLGIALGTPILGWLSNVVQSRKLVLHISLVLGNMALLLAIYLPHFSFSSLILIKSISFFTGFFLSGSMLFYTVVKEAMPESTQGLALSVANTGVFLFNSLMLLLPYIFITTSSTQFFTYLWILPFFVMISILLNYFIRDKN